MIFAIVSIDQMYVVAIVAIGALLTIAAMVLFPRRRKQQPQANAAGILPETLEEEELPQTRFIGGYSQGSIQQIDIDDHLYLLSVPYNGGSAHMIHAEHCQCKERSETE